MALRKGLVTGAALSLAVLLIACGSGESTNYERGFQTGYEDALTVVCAAFADPQGELLLAFTAEEWAPMYQSIKARGGDLLDGYNAGWKQAMKDYREDSFALIEECTSLQ